MAKEVISGIYKIELKDEFKEQSSCNGIYIGQSIDVYKRWKIHKSNVRNGFRVDKYLYSAMNKYGVENFYFEIIEECEYHQLNEHEIYWIKYYNSYTNGYNLTYGGDSCLNKNGISISAYLTQNQADNIRKLYNNSKLKIYEISEKYKISYGVVSSILNSETYLTSDYSKRFRKIVGDRYDNPKNKSELITEVDASNIREYYQNNHMNISKSDCANKFNLSHPTFMRVINNKIWIDNNYDMSYLDDVKYYIRGEKSYLSKLKKEDIREIRDIYYSEDITTVKLAEKYNVSQTNISDILNNKIWVDDEYGKSKRFNNKNKYKRLNKSKVLKIRILSKLNNSNIKNLSNIFNTCIANIKIINKNKTWFDEDYQKFLDGDININEFANIKNLNIEDLKEWFNNGE